MQRGREDALDVVNGWRVDWNCDGIATPVLFRPSTGASLYYDTWSTNEKPSDTATRCRSIS